jgi:hypothetical protein
LTVAEAGDVVFVAAEGLIFFVESKDVSDMCTGGLRKRNRASVSVLEFEGAELLVDDLPDYLV